MANVFDLQEQGPGFIAQDPHKKQDMVVHACNPMLGRWEQEGP